LTALVFQLIYASLVPFPGTDDGLVYYHVAQQITQGEGITVPYVWNFFATPESLTPPAFGYWIPLASFVTIPGLYLSGQNSALAALLSQGIRLMALVMVTYGIDLVSSTSTLPEWWCRWVRQAE
jgi:hypothetical protein